MGKLYTYFNSLVESKSIIKDFVEHLSDLFDYTGVTIYDKRNKLKIFDIEGVGQIAVKRFKKPWMLQNIAYSFFQKSKAERAYYNAKTLIERNFKTPYPYAYTEERNIFYLLKYTYLVTDVTNFRPLKCVLKEDHKYNAKVLIDFAHLVAKLHQAGIFHHDLNDTNVLFQRNENETLFMLIDNNRMTIYPKGKQLQKPLYYENLTRFTNSIDKFSFVAQEYLKAQNWDESCLKDMIEVKIKHDKQRLRRKRLLHPKTERYKRPLT